MTNAEWFLRDVWYGEQQVTDFRKDVKLSYYHNEHLAYCKDLQVRVDGSLPQGEDRVFLTTLYCGHGVENHVEFKADPSCWILKGTE